MAEPLTADGARTEGEDYATRSEAMAELVNWYIEENWRAMPGEGDTLIAVEGDEDVYQISIVEPATA